MRTRGRAGLVVVVVVVVVVGVLATACTVHEPSNAVLPHATPSPVVSLAGSYVAPCSRGSTDEQIFAQSLRMVSPTTGWASAQCTLPTSLQSPNCGWPGISVVGIVRSVDGGRHWVDVSPPSVANRTWSHAQFFLDPNRAWVAELARSTASCVDTLTTFSTEDGGKTWQQGGSIKLNTGPTNAVFNIATEATNWIQFVDPNNGWLLVPWWPTVLSDNILQQAALYGTTDGGQTWKFLARNPGSPAAAHARGCASTDYGTEDMEWVSATDGWIEINCPVTTLVHSTDGGAHWTVQPLPNCICNEYLMSFVDPQHGFMTGDAQTILATADGGATWTQRPVPRGADRIDFSDAMHARTVVVEQQASSYEVAMFATADGGVTWSKVGTLPVPVRAIPSPGSGLTIYPSDLTLQFVDARHGFVVQLARPNQSGGLQESVVLFGTANAGATWLTILSEYTDTCNSYGALIGAPQPVKMATLTTGWAHGGLRTTDGGVTWKDVSSPALREGQKGSAYPDDYTDFFLDADHAWQAAVYDSATACSDHIETFATADGGQSWTQSAPIPIIPSAAHHFGTIEIAFATLHLGWLLVTYVGNSGNYPPADSGDLYSTTDGGSHWQHVTGISLPTGSRCSLAGPIAFASAVNGWLAMNCSSPAMLVTSDGGVTWRVQKLPFDISPPRFFDATHGVAQLIGGSDNAGLVTTADGGATWTTHALPTTGCAQFVNCNGSVPDLDFAAVNDFWDIARSLPPKDPNASFDNSVLLFHSTDGGARWSSVKTDLHVLGSALDGQITAFLMDGRRGLVAETYTSNTDQTTYLLLRTVDGGHTWTVINPTVQWQS